MFYAPVYRRDIPKFEISSDDSWLVDMHCQIENISSHCDSIKLQQLRKIYLKLYGRLSNESDYSILAKTYIRIYNEINN